MIKYFVKKLCLMICMMLIISFVIFVALNSTGVDPVSFTVDINSYDSAKIEIVREELGLNDPLVIRYFRWLNDILHGNLGYSIAKGYSVSEVIIGRWPASLELTIGALIISTILGIGIGMISAYRQNGIIDYLGRGLAVLGNSMPSYFFALILIQIFSVKLNWFPTGGRIPIGAVTFWDRLPNLVLPILAMAIPMTGNLARYTRNTMLDVANQEYVKTARMKGVSEIGIYFRHIFRNGMRPVVTVLLYRLDMLIGGSVAVETVFAWSGCANVLTSALTSSDYPVVMVYTLMLSAIMLIISLLVDLFTAILDPRVRFNF